MECSVTMGSSTGQECCGEAERNTSCTCQTKVWTSSAEVWHFSKHLSNEDNKDHCEFSRCLWLWCSGREHKACLSCRKANWCSGAAPENSRITLENDGTDWNRTVLQMTSHFLWKSPQAVLFTPLFLSSDYICGLSAEWAEGPVGQLLVALLPFEHHRRVWGCRVNECSSSQPSGN